ncbi:MAG: acyl-ACP desaturase [Thermoplasmatota archaeon]
MNFEFDLDRFLRNSTRVNTDDLAWDAVRDHSLRNGEVRFLTYMMNIESHTIVYLRDLLSTSAIEDTDITAFLSCWAYEEFFHGYYLERFLKAYVGTDAVHNSTKARLDEEGRVKSAFKRALTPGLTALSPDFAATHMTWGASQEYTTLHGYEALARQSEHPVLKEIMARIVKDERRHFAFYYNVAKARLERSPFMQRETRWFMDHLWRPVGAGAMPKGELDFVAWYLFRDPQGLADVAHVDAVMGRLPGMNGWAGLSKEVHRSLGRLSTDGSLEPWAYARATPSPGSGPSSGGRPEWVPAPPQGPRPS